MVKEEVKQEIVIDKANETVAQEEVKPEEKVEDESLKIPEFKFTFT